MHLGGLLKEGQEDCGDHVELGDVCAVSGSPVLKSRTLRIKQHFLQLRPGLAFGRLLSSADASVVHKDAEAFLA